MHDLTSNSLIKVNTNSSSDENVTSYKESFPDIVKKKEEDAVQKTVIKISFKRIEYSNV